MACPCRLAPGVSRVLCLVAAVVSVGRLAAWSAPRRLCGLPLRRPLPGRGWPAATANCKDARRGRCPGAGPCGWGRPRVHPLLDRTTLDDACGPGGG